MLLQMWCWFLLHYGPAVNQVWRLSDVALNVDHPITKNRTNWFWVYMGMFLVKIGVASIQKRIQYFHCMSGPNKSQLAINGSPNPIHVLDLVLVNCIVIKNDWPCPWTVTEPSLIMSQTVGLFVVMSNLIHWAPVHDTDERPITVVFLLKAT